MQNSHIQIKIFLLILTIVGQFQISLQNGVIVTNGLISHFGFSNNYYDRASTKSGTGTVGFSTDKWNRPNEALNLSGSNYVNLDHNQFRFLENERYKLSIALWVYPTRFSFVVFDHRASFSYNEAGYQLQLNNDGKMVFMSSDDDSSECDDTIFGYQDDCVEVSSGRVYLNQWGHIAVTKNNNIVRFYVNGGFTNQETQATTKINYDGDENQRWIGRAYDGDGYDGVFHQGTQQYGKGKIDDLRIYNRAITDNEVSQLYDYAPPHQCQTTEPGSTWCQTCKGDRSLSNNDCICPDQKFEDYTSTNCPDCHYKCDGCSGQADNCSVCEDPSNRTAANCGCKFGMVDIGVAACATCSHQCESCSGSITGCLTCNDTENRSLPNCDCQDGWLDIGVSNCAECDYQCATCSGDVNTCATCVDPTNRELNTNCDCKIGWLDVGVENCSECDYQCESCTGDINTCATCVDPNNRELSSNCGCKDGWLDLNQENCFECDYQCATCTGDVNTCATCEDPTNRELNSNCDCKIGWLDVGVETCAQCNYKCGSCSGNINTCLTCSDLTNRINDSVCDCQDGWFDIGIPECQQCDHQCETCSGTTEGCLTCSHETRHIDLNCGCIKSYFETGEVECQKCDVKCLSCETNSTNCGECKSGIGRTMAFPSCGCQEGFYEVEGQLNCEQCLPHCKSCENGNECTSCYLENQEGKDCEIKLTNPLFNIPGHRQPDLLIDCPIECEKNCQSIEGVIKCTQCSEGKFRSMETPLCGCLEGHFSEPGEIHCQQCKPTCQTCSNSLSCDTCISEQNRFYNKVSQNCECKRGYRNPTKQGEYICQRCLLYQGECFTECPKHTIFDQIEQECVDKEIQLSANKNTIYALGVIFLVAQFVLLKFVLPMMMGNKRLNNGVKYEDDAFYESQYNQAIQKYKQLDINLDVYQVQSNNSQGVSSLRDSEKDDIQIVNFE